MSPCAAHSLIARMPSLNARAPLPATIWLCLPDSVPAEGLVREWLSMQTGRPEHDIHFARDAAGRPHLQAPLADHDVNWSHSGGRLLAAVVRHARVGVDIELIQTRRRIDDIATRYLTAGEQAWLQRLNGRDKLRGFHRLWCAKEAILKAHGQGLSFGLDRLELLPDSQGRLQIRALDPALGGLDDWTLREWIPAAGFVAALAVRAG